MRVMKKKLSSWETIKKEILSDSKTLKEYNNLEPEYEIIRETIKARIHNDITQAELARRMRTRQSNISRFERGESNPTIHFLKKIASAFGKKLHISFT